MTFSVQVPIIYVFRFFHHWIYLHSRLLHNKLLRKNFSQWNPKLDGKTWLSENIISVTKVIYQIWWGGCDDNKGYSIKASTDLIHLHTRLYL